MGENMLINNEEQLKLVVTGLMERAMYITMNELLEELRDCIEDEVYGIGEPKIYERTNEFYESWEMDKKIISKNIIEGSIFENLLTMHKDSSKFQHVVDNLAEVLNEGLANKWALGEGWWSQKRPFWDKFIDYVDANIELLYIKNLAELGLTITL